MPDYRKLSDTELNTEIWQRRISTFTTFADSELEGHDYINDKDATWDALCQMRPVRFSLGQRLCIAFSPEFNGDYDANPARAVWLAWLAWRDTLRGIRDKLRELET